MQREHAEGCTESPRASEVKASVDVKIGGKDKECTCDPNLVAL